MFIGRWGRERISLTNLTEFPPFLRFNEVLLFYSRGLQSLITKCHLLEGYLNAIKPVLKDSNITHFTALIDYKDQSQFSDNSSVVMYLRDRLLPICDSSRRYEFIISFNSDKNSASELTSSILQISQVRSCSHVSIVLFGNQSARLPVEEISNWLTPKTVEGAEICGKKGENRFLLIYSDIISNTKEMWEHLIKVNFFIANFFHRPHLEI